MQQPTTPIRPSSGDYGSGASPQYASRAMQLALGDVSPSHRTSRNTNMTFDDIQHALQNLNSQPINDGNRNSYHSQATSSTGKLLATFSTELRFHRFHRQHIARITNLSITSRTTHLHREWYHLHRTGATRGFRPLMPKHMTNPIHGRTQATRYRKKTLRRSIMRLLRLERKLRLSMSTQTCNKIIPSPMMNRST